MLKKKIKKKKNDKLRMLYNELLLLYIKKG
jgi:hypothetical protein